MRRKRADVTAGCSSLAGALIGDKTERVGKAVSSSSLEDTPVFIGCSDRDAHIPLERVQETTQILISLGAEVTEKIYPAMGHTINEDELMRAREIVKRLV